ncbi:MAG: 4-hydroxy-tetrahydrodipicolinate synthase [Calditrichia bacterium]
MFEGMHVALITPFDEKLNVNFEALKKLVHFHLEKGTDGLVVCGTTGESPTLSEQEKLAIFKTVIEEVNGKIPVIAGTGNYNTQHTIEFTRKAKELGADGALLVVPYYNKPTQEGLFRHFKAIADAVDLPQIIYNIPGRTGVNMLPSTIARLADHPNIVAVKEASGNVGQISELCKLVGNKLAVLSGDDGLTLPIISVGGKGVISAAGNIVPAKIKEMVVQMQEKNFARALELHQKLEDLNQVLFLETNPIPVKTALNLMGFNVGGFRLPLCEMQPENVDKLKAVLQKYGLIG